MKRSFTIPLIAMFMACVLSPSTMTAGNNTSHNVTMHKTPNKHSEPNTSLDPIGRRTPSMPIYCTISQTTGIEGLNLSEDVVSYEVWDASSEIKIAAFSEESEFIDFLFSQTGEFQIKLETENYYIIGNIKLGIQ